MTYVMVQLRIPLDVWQDAQAVADDLTVIHMDSKQTFEKTKEKQLARAVAQGDEKVIATLHAEELRLAERARRLTLNNVARAAMEVGLKTLKADPTEALLMVEKNGLARGKPRGG